MAFYNVDIIIYRWLRTASVEARLRIWFKFKQKSSPSLLILFGARRAKAEEEGFEPPVRVNVRRFSRPVHSTSSAIPPYYIYRTSLSPFFYFFSSCTYRKCISTCRSFSEGRQPALPFLQISG